jgi:hypothetical protein
LRAIGDIAVYSEGSFCRNYLPMTLIIIDTAGKTATNIEDFK